MTHKSGCLVCGKELIYKNTNEKSTCLFCRDTFYSYVKCSDGHYICDGCHSMSANEFIQKHCLASQSLNPLELAAEIMKHPSVSMHGPEHHFLIPAVLLTAYYNKNGNIKDKKASIIKAGKRAEKILGGFCGTHGNCGAAVGTGIFASLITNNTPLAREEWKESNMMTAKSLSFIAERGGPRCCKRNSFLAIRAAAAQFDIDVSDGKKNVKCSFAGFNKECLKASCPFFQAPFKQGS